MNPYQQQEDAKSNNNYWSQSSFDFGQFNYASNDQSTIGNPYSNTTPNMATFTPSIPTMGTYDYSANPDDPFAGEPPLLEELGINFEHIIQKTFAVLNPFKKTDPSILQDADLAGPLVFGLTFGAFLLLSGKVHFSYIYGFGVLGCLLIYGLLTMMSPPNVSFSAVCTLSILGYCLLPMALLSAVAIFLNLQTFVGTIITFTVIMWCALSASKLFVTALSMNNQQALVAYPCILFYGVFALLALF